MMLRNILQWGGAGSSEYGNEYSGSVMCGEFWTTRGLVSSSGRTLFQRVNLVELLSYELGLVILLFICKSVS
jgi:hypothetical protein